MSGRRLRVGLVGANWGLTHVAAWRSVPGVELTAICTSNEQSAETAARAHGIAQAYGDAMRMIADPALDLIDVTPRPTVRAPIVLAALQAGKHVIQPLPFALSLSQARTLRDTARSKGVVGIVENLHRHSPAFRQAKAMIEAAVIGEVLSFKAFVRTDILLEPPVGWPYLWLLGPDSGASALRNFGAHMMHVLHWYFGAVAAVAARIRTHVETVRPVGVAPLRNGTADSASVLLDFEGGIDGMLDVSWCTPGQNAFSLDIAGSRGRIVLEAEGLGPRAVTLKLTEQAHQAVQPVVIDAAFRRGSTVQSRDDTLESLAFMCQRAATAIALADPAGATPDFDEALAVMEVVEAAYWASETRTWVRLDEFRQRSSLKRIA